MGGQWWWGSRGGGVQGIDGCWGVSGGVEGVQRVMGWGSIGGGGGV